jgi:hypothetical protein
MSKKDRLSLLVFAGLLFVVAICSALPSYIPVYSPGGIPSLPYAVDQSNSGILDSASSSDGPSSPLGETSLPNEIPDIGYLPSAQTLNNPTEDTDTYGGADDLDHPSSAPEEQPPVNTPSLNTGKAITNLANGQILQTQDVVAAFGSEPQDSVSTESDQAISIYPSGSRAVYPAYIPPTNKIQFFAFYKNKWTMKNSALSMGHLMNLIVVNNRKQHLWAYDSNTWTKWQDLGKCNKGLVSLQFLADTSGWHHCIIWGSKSGWSNSLWIWVP